MGIPTIIGLIFMVASFFLIGMGSETKVEERKANYSFLGFVLLLISTLMLGTVVAINMLG